MENIIGKEVRHIKTGQVGIVAQQYDFDFTQYMIFVGHGFAKWHYHDIEVIPEEEIVNELEKLGEARQPSDKGKND